MILGRARLLTTPSEESTQRRLPAWKWTGNEYEVEGTGFPSMFVSPGACGLVVRTYLKLMGRPCDDLDISKFHGDEPGREINRHLLRALVACCRVVVGIVVVLFIIAWWDVHS